MLSIFTSNYTLLVLSLAKNALDKFREKHPSERAFISIKCYPWDSARKYKRLKPNEQPFDDSTPVKIINENKVETQQLPKTIDYTVEETVVETIQYDLSKTSDRKKFEKLKKVKDVNPGGQIKKQLVSKVLKQEHIEDMFPINSVIEITDGDEELNQIENLQNSLDFERNLTNKLMEDISALESEIKKMHITTNISDLTMNSSSIKQEMVENERIKNENAKLRTENTNMIRILQEEVKKQITITENCNNLLKKQDRSH